MIAAVGAWIAGKVSKYGAYLVAFLVLVGGILAATAKLYSNGVHAGALREREKANEEARKAALQRRQVDDSVSRMSDGDVTNRLRSRWHRQ